LANVSSIDHPMADVQFGYLDTDGTWHAVATLEEGEYPTYYHRRHQETDVAPMPPVDGTPSGGSNTVPKAEAEPAKPTEPEPELFEGHRDYQEGDRGVSYESLLVPYLQGASLITIVDPFIRMFHQARNLMELIDAIAQRKDPADEVTLKLITVENQESPEKAQRQLENLFQIKQSAASLGIVLDVEFVDPHAIHDRSITTDTGWKILLGRGLDIFQRTTDSPFELATKYQKHRELKGFGITYLRDAIPKESRTRSEGY
jgi:ATP-dependent Lon protease